MVNESMRLLRDFYFDKRVFITGHTGFKGAWLCEILLSFGAQVGGYALAPTSNTPLFNLLNLAQRTRSYLGDIRSFDVFRKSMLDFQPEIVIHLAAQPLVLASYQNPVYTYEVNVMGTVHVLEALRYCPTVRSFLNVTTDKVYENREWVWGYREDERLCGQDPYSNSKSCSELTTFSYKNSFFNKEDALGGGTLLAAVTFRRTVLFRTACVPPWMGKRYYCEILSLSGRISMFWTAFMVICFWR